MPPKGPIKDEEVEVMRKWISGLSIAKNKPLSESEVLGLIRNDVEQKVAAGFRKNTRYLSFHVASNLGADLASLKIQRDAMLKVLNSISRSPLLVKPEAIDSQKLVYRLRLDELALPTALFDSLLSDFYPFSQKFVTVGEEQGARRAADNQNFLQTELGTENFFVRGDWFIATAMLPQAYTRLMELGANQAELDSKLGIDNLRDLVENKAIRSGFKNSNVSTQNRIIERHAQNNGLSYWTSYDFVSNEGVSNIFGLPLGPVGVGFDSLAFEQDGGEIIFQLPNGMFGFYLSNAAGVALDKGPTSIVKQNDAPAQFLTAIVNGLSCMSCHNQGLIPKKDEIRSFFKANAVGLSNPEISKIFNLYPEENTFKDAMAKDNAMYLKAAKELGLDTTKADPVNQAYRYYNRALTRNDVREELGLTDPQVNTLLTLEPFRSRWPSLQQPGGFMKREEFNLLLGEAFRVSKAQILVINPLLGDMLITPSCMFADPFRMDSCLIRKPPPPPPPALEAALVP